MSDGFRRAWQQAAEQARLRPRRPITPNRRELAEYYASEAWARNRAPALVRAAGRCERCGKRCACLEAHHLTYERLGHERAEDLLVVCGDCHPIVDHEREVWERWQARVRGLARHRYGPDWERRITFDEACTELEDFLGYGVDELYDD